MYTRFLQTLKIQPGEGVRVGLMSVYSLAAVGGGVVLGRAVSRSLFLSQLPESAVPFKYILPPFFVIAGILLYNRLVPHYPMYRLIAATNLLLISGLLVFRFFLDSSFSGSFALLAAIYIYFEIIATAIGIQFWSFAGEVFNPREAKRLFGLITAGGVLANAIAGFGLRLASSFILPKDLIFVVAGSLFFGVLCVWILGKLKAGAPGSRAPSDHPLHRPRPAAHGSSSTPGDLREIARQPLLVTLAALIVLTSLVTNISDFQLDLSLQRYFAHDGQGMLSYLGTLQIFVGIAAVLIQVFLTNRILERFGLTAGLLLLPLAVATGSVAFLVSAGALWAMGLPRGADMTLRYTVNDASQNVLFLPVPEDFRKRVKALLDGVIKPPVTALLGLLFLLFLRDDIDQVGVQARDVVPWSYVILALIVIWGMAVLRTRRYYASALMERLKRYRLAFEQTQFDIRDETTVALIREELQKETSNPYRVINMIEMLKSSQETSWHSLILPLLGHSSPEVRRLAAQYFEERAALAGDPGIPTHILSLFQDPDMEVRAAAVQSYCALRAEAALEEVVPLLNAGELRVRQAAIAGLMKYAGLSGVIEAAVALKQLFASSTAREREAGAAVLGSLQVRNYYQPLLPLLDDLDDAVQRQAILSAGQLRHPGLLRRLIEKLDEPRQENYARQALAGYGTSAVHHLAAVLEDASSTKRRVSAARVLRSIPAPESATALRRYLQDPNDQLRAVVARALVSLQADGVEPGIPRPELLESTLAEITRTYAIHLLVADLGNEIGPLLGRALREYLEYTIDHVFSLLSLLYPQLDTSTIQSAVRSGGGQKITALELIDSMADREIREVMLPLVEAPQARIIQIAGARFGLARSSAEERLNELARNEDPILRACAIYQLGALGCDSLPEVIRQNLDYNHMLVQETVLWAVMFAASEQEVRPLLRRQTTSQFASVRAYAKSLLKEIGE